DDVIFVFTLVAARRWSLAVAARRLSGLRAGFVHGFGELVAGTGQLVYGRVDAVRVGFSDGLLGVFNSRFDFLSLCITDLGPVLLQRLFDVVDHGIGAVLGFDRVALLAIVCRVRLGVARHLLHLVLRKARG